MNSKKVIKNLFLPILSLVIASSLMFVSLASEKQVDATICPPMCVDQAKQHLDEAKKSLDAGDTEGAKIHIDKAKESLGDSSK